MKIDSGTSNLYAARPRQSTAVERGEPSSFAAVLGTTVAATSRSDSGAAKPADFTNMTRREMRDWTNAQIRGGRMSLEDSRPFMAMTMNIPVNGGVASAGDDGERIDFTAKIRAGIEGALSRNDETTRKMLESAMALLK